jgi:prepilin-type processing-associated H-X9-DG protein
MLAEFMGVEWLAWWQIVLLPLWIAIPLFGGGTLLWVGGRYCARVPKATYWRSIGTNALAGLAGGLTYMVVSFLAAAVMGGRGSVLGALVGAAGGLFVTWLIIMGMFGTSFPKAILAWLPTLPVGIFNACMLAAMLVPTLQQANEVTNRTVCMSRLKSIGVAIIMHQSANSGRMPANFEALIAEGQPAKQLTCPSVDSALRPPGRKWDYLYLPARDTSSTRIIACDFRANHRGIVRNVLFADCHVSKMTEAQLQALLAQPENADFAIALRAADGP